MGYLELYTNIEITINHKDQNWRIKIDNCIQFVLQLFDCIQISPLATATCQVHLSVWWIYCCLSLPHQTTRQHLAVSSTSLSLDKGTQLSQSLVLFAGAHSQQMKVSLNFRKHWLSLERTLGNDKCTLWSMYTNVLI